MRLIFSSFLVGAITSSYAVVNLTESVRQRKHFLEPKFDEEEFRAFMYQAVSFWHPIEQFWFVLSTLKHHFFFFFMFQELNQKLQEKKYGGEGYVQKETQKFIHDQVVPTVRDNVNKLFSVPIQELVDDMIKKFTENKDKQA